MARIELPDEVVKLLRSAADGATPAIYPLITIDSDQFPHTSLSSARQWRVGDSRLAVVLTPGRTTRYLQRRPRALLVVVGADCVYYIRLQVAVVKAMDHHTVVAFEISGIEADTRGVALTPMRFAATDDLVRYERISPAVEAVADELAQRGT